MFIQTEDTTNPATLRFLPGRTVTGGPTLTFAAGDAAADAPLAQALLAVSGVAAVALGPEHIEVTAAEGADWAILRPMVLRAIMEHFRDGAPAVLEGAAANGAGGANGDGGGDGDDAEKAEIVAQLRELIDTRIHPAVAQSGGDIAFHDFIDGIAILELEGPAIGLKQPITNMLRHYVPEVTGVRTREEHERLQLPEMNTPEALAIRRLLDEEVNPAIASHGGNIALIDIKPPRVYIRLEGGCQGCGMANVTLKQGVEVAIRRAVPAITEVLDVTDHAGGTNPYYQPGKGGASPV